ncbi:response regulator transcription factor [Nocardioides sp. R1-1]|uniref:response regulator transcription factor n=1 Tax=Nocardioides sp. R1-1 TaxID=3383502 RepID=UPI0038D226BF
MLRILLVEDDQGVAEALTQRLRRNGYGVRHAGTAEEARERHHDVDLVLLDMGLPDRDGLWLCQEIRRTSAVPIVALTARRTESSVVAALRAGVDDYVTKPYSLAVLLARVEAVMRRASAQPDAAPAPDFGVELLAESREVRTTEGTVALTAKEFDLLRALLRGAGSPVTRAALMEEVWDTTWVGASRTLDVHVASLRGKLGASLAIETVRGVGYRVVAVERGAP